MLKYNNGVSFTLVTLGVIDKEGFIDSEFPYVFGATYNSERELLELARVEDISTNPEHDLYDYVDDIYDFRTGKVSEVVDIVTLSYEEDSGTVCVTYYNYGVNTEEFYVERNSLDNRYYETYCRLMEICDL